ncbi:MAG: signal peptidase II [Pseudomonadota bacterium]
MSLIALAILIADQAVKWWVVERLSLKTLSAIDVLPPFLNLRMAWNYGINFGLFGGTSDAQRWALVALAVGISAVLAIWAARAGGRWIPTGAGLVIGGALGNAWDRVVYGAVADFLNMSCCGIANPFSFNIADISIFAGAALLIFAPSPGAAQKGA